MKPKGLNHIQRVFILVPLFGASVALLIICLALSFITWIF